MKIHLLDKMVKGWIVGDFLPSVCQTNQFEVSIKEYKSGDSEPAHYHKVAKEISAVVSGKIRMNGRVFIKGQIVELDPGEIADFQSLTDSITVVVKIPSVVGDKYLV